MEILTKEDRCLDVLVWIPGIFVDQYWHHLWLILILYEDFLFNFLAPPPLLMRSFIIVRSYVVFVCQRSQKTIVLDEIQMFIVLEMSNSDWIVSGKDGNRIDHLEIIALKVAFIT